MMFLQPLPVSLMRGGSVGSAMWFFVIIHLSFHVVDTTLQGKDRSNIMM